jgi:hypothetical protein
MLPLFFYKEGFREVDARGNHKVSNYETLRAFMAFSADDIAVSLIKWVGTDYRWVIGVMFSGLFGTSAGDTLYAIWAKTAFRMHCHRRLETWCKSVGLTPEETRAELNLLQIVSFAKKYGDDLIDLLVAKHLWLVVSPEPASFVELQTRQGNVTLKPHYMQGWYKRNFNLDIKMSETRIFTHEEPWTTVVNHKFDVMVTEGPVYLKRRTIRLQSKISGEVDYFPWRSTSDYIAKCCNTVSMTGVGSATYWIAKWRGLMIDTCGTNVMAYAFLRYLHDYFIEEWEGVEKHLEDDVRYYLREGVWPRGESDLIPLFKKLAVHFDMSGMVGMTRCPTRREIFEKYVPNEHILSQRAHVHSLVRHYRDPMKLIQVTTKGASSGHWETGR